LLNSVEASVRKIDRTVSVVCALVDGRPKTVGIAANVGTVAVWSAV